MDVFMLVMTIILAVVLIIVNIYLLAYYSHPDDKGHVSAYICMGVVIIGMTLSWAQVLMLPLDVSNARSSMGSLRMDIFWMVVYIATGVMLLFIIPIFSSWYESDPEWTCCQKICFSFCYFIVSTVVILVILLVTYAFLSTAEIPVTTVNCSILDMQPSNTTSSIELNSCTTSASTLDIGVSFIIYCIGFMSFISWFLFCLFGGIGLPALPLDYIYDFCTRPKKVSPKELQVMQDKMVDRAKQIKEIGEQCKNLEVNEQVLTKGCKCGIFTLFFFYLF